MTTTPRFLLALLVAAAAVLSAPPAHAATIVIVNNDGAGEGFNDATPASPVGGNPGTTRGAQRLNVFQHAAAIWGGILPSNVTIQVLAQFNSQTCDATSAVLGSAGARSVHADFPGAEFSNMWYHQALANKLSNADQSALEDINATFNSDLDNPVCLGDVGWYYGFDGNEGPDVELLPVVLHELGHGLGFSTFTTTSTGQFLSNTPDIFAHFLYDRSTAKHWDQMNTNNQRKTSATNTGNLVWDGFATKFLAPNTLEHEPEVLVTAPGGIAGSYAAVLGEMGDRLDGTEVTQNVVLAVDNTAPTSDACEPLVNAAALNGRIALIDRGVCTFVSKALAAQAAGAVGLIVANNVAGSPITMAGTDPSITIPCVMISQADGNTIKSALAGNTVTATLRRSPNLLAGAYADNGQVRMYAPNPLVSGSSVSHFDDVAYPDLLMEPAINDGLHDQVDLTRAVFEDIGWLPRLTSVEPTPTASGAPGFRVQSAPNPFQPATVITMTLPTGGATQVEVYDIRGRLVRRLVNSWLPAGSHAVAWDGTDAGGRGAGAGVYFAKIVSGGYHSAQRLVKLKY